jgi:predicted dithiol-disulfide oxidoreductase (DUF899 family)
MTHAELMQMEKDLLQAKQRLTEARKKAAPEPIKDYTLRTVPSGSPVKLSELFAGGNELLVVHNMGKKCPYCTLWADGFSSMYKHLANRCAFVLTTPDEPTIASTFASARAWTFPVVSHAGTSFAQDLGFKGEQEHQYGIYKPGISAMHREADGAITRTGSRPFGPGDDFCALWPMFDLLQGGVGEWTPKYHY